MTTAEPTLAPARAGLSRPPLEAVALTVWAGLFAVVLGDGLRACDGSFFYTLDDAYIHLSVGWHILQGGYGINAGEYSSPSSSILWPYLVALTQALGFGSLGPLALNIGTAAATLVVALRMLRREGVFASSAPWFPYVLGCLVIFVVSAVALPITGMEHCLHVLLAVVVLDELLKVAGGGRSVAPIVAAVVLTPLVRFEGFAFSGAAIIALWVLGARGAAVASTLLLGAICAGYAVVATSRVLPLLTSSVLLKSATASAAYGHHNPLRELIANLKALMGPGRPLMFLGLGLVIAAILDRRRSRHVVVWCAVLAGIAGHVLTGAYGWFYRYEVYITAIAALAFAMALCGGGQAAGRRNATTCLVVTLVFAALSIPYLLASYLSPSASQNVYDQQYQMARFAQEVYGGPVAVNDLGLVSYKNKQFVLDLWGLGSEPVRQLRRDGAYSAAAMESLADKNNVGLAMIYESWFVNGDPESGKLNIGLPASWKRIAVLHTPVVSAGDHQVSFFATPKADLKKLRGQLESFAPSLPAEDWMTFDAR